ncbi:MAG: hypothetical protein R3212_10935, partial [Xanthomonadales bacterium]|nr:hypothetical protein [Xanthomonadales bacterium]
MSQMAKTNVTFPQYTESYPKERNRAEWGAMAHIMIGYELGGGHGHLYRLLPPVRALEAQGHRVTLFLRNIRENAFLLSGENRALLPVPDGEFFDPGDELMVSSPTNVSGLTVFSTFVPEKIRTKETGG